MRWHDVNVRRYVVGFVPPENVDEKGANAMSKCVELEQGYRHVLAKARDALRAEPESLSACNELGQSAGLTWVLKDGSLKWQQTARISLCHSEEIPESQCLYVAIDEQDAPSRKRIESCVHGPGKSVFVQLRHDIINLEAPLFALESMQIAIMS